MIKVEITNFESVGHAEIVMEGFTTIVGRNYIGKSSILRAINAALTNQQGTDFIKWGESFCEVRIKAPSLDLVWHKEEGNNFYKINKKTYKKIGRDDPPSPVGDAGFKMLKIGGQKLNLNYAEQFFPLFLVDKQDSKSADLLTSVYGLDRLYDAVSLCNKEQRSCNDELRLKEKELSILSSDLDRFKNIEELRESVRGIKQEKISLESKQREIDKIRAWASGMQLNVSACKKLKPCLIINLPDRKELTSRIDELVALHRYAENVQVRSDVLKALKPALGVSVPEEDRKKLASAIEDFQKLVTMSTRAKTLGSQVKALHEAATVEIPTPQVDVDEIEKLLAYQEGIEKAKKELLQSKAELKNIEESLTELHTEKSKYKTCPLCKRPLDPAGNH